MEKYTITQFRNDYPNDDACLDKIWQLRFSNLVCPICESENTYTKTKDRRSYQCSSCAHQIYPTQGTVFEKSTTPLTHWFYAIYLQTTTRNGVAAKELERQLNVCYKTALRMAHQIKRLMANNSTEPLMGIVEADETFIGGQHKNKHKKERALLNEKGTGAINKVPVMGLLERNGRIVVLAIDKAEGKVLKPIIRENVDRDSTLVTDGFGGYSNLHLEFKQHEIISHDKDEYVRGIYHTNTIEGFWSQLKRTIKGTHIHVSRKHLQKYVDEVAFRYEHRKEQDGMFDAILSRVVSA